MNLLSIFNTGGLTLGITLFTVALIVWFIYNYIKVRRAGHITTTKHGDIYDNEKVPVKKNPFAAYAVIVVIAYVVVLLLIHSDYRPYDPKKDGPIKPKVEDNRKAAEEMIGQ